MEILYAVTRTRRRNYEDIFTDLRRPVATVTSVDISHVVRYGCRATTGTRGRTSATRMEFYSGSRWRRWQRSRTPERAFPWMVTPGGRSVALALSTTALADATVRDSRVGGRIGGPGDHYDWRSAPNPSPAHDRCVGRLREPETVLPRSSAGIKPQISQAPTTRVERQLL